MNEDFLKSLLYNGHPQLFGYLLKWNLVEMKTFSIHGCGCTITSRPQQPSLVHNIFFYRVPGRDRDRVNIRLPSPILYLEYVKTM